MYYIQVSDNKIVAKGYTKKDIELEDGFFEITKTQYDYIRASAIVVFDEDGNPTDIQNEPEPIEEMSAKIDEIMMAIKRLENSMVGLERKIYTSEVIK